MFDCQDLTIENQAMDTTEKAVNLQNSSTKHQYFATFIVNLLTFTYGISIGWLTPVMDTLLTEESPLPGKPLTLDEVSWIAGSDSIGGLIGSFFFGYMMDTIGRRKALILMFFPAIVSWLLMLFAQNVYYLFGARILSGFLGGGVYVVIPTYLAEIANDRIRGSLCSSMTMVCDIGTTVAFILGYYCNFYVTPQLAILVTIGFVIGFYYMPETPYYLVKKNCVPEAKKSIQFYLSLTAHSYDDIETVQLELHKLKSMCHDDSEKEASTSMSWTDFKTREARKSFMIGVVLVIMVSFSGVYGMLTYSDIIIKEADPSLSPSISVIVVSIVQVLGDFVSAALTDRTGRKFLLLLTAVGVALGMSIFGTYTLLKPVNPDVMPWLSMIPVCSLAFIIFIGSCGVATLPYAIFPEIMPERLKGFGVSFLMTLVCLSQMFELKFLPFIMEAIGLHGATFMYAGVCLMCSIFVFFVMPETRGKSYEEVMKSLR